MNPRILHLKWYRTTQPLCFVVSYVQPITQHFQINNCLKSTSAIYAYQKKLCFVVSYVQPITQHFQINNCLKSTSAIYTYQKWCRTPQLYQLPPKLATKLVTKFSNRHQLSCLNLAMCITKFSDLYIGKISTQNLTIL